MRRSQLRRKEPSLRCNWVKESLELVKRFCKADEAWKLRSKNGGCQTPFPALIRSSASHSASITIPPAMAQKLPYPNPTSSLSLLSQTPESSCKCPPCPCIPAACVSQTDGRSICYPSFHRIGTSTSLGIGWLLNGKSPSCTHGGWFWTVLCFLLTCFT